jgi:hypothetical protein
MKEKEKTITINGEKFMYKQINKETVFFKMKLKPLLNTKLYTQEKLKSRQDYEIELPIILFTVTIEIEDPQYTKEEVKTYIDVSYNHYLNTVKRKQEIEKGEIIHDDISNSNEITINGEKFMYRFNHIHHLNESEIKRMEQYNDLKQYLYNRPWGTEFFKEYETTTHVIKNRKFFKTQKETITTKKPIILFRINEDIYDLNYSKDEITKIVNTAYQKYKRYEKRKQEIERGEII